MTKFYFDYETFLFYPGLQCPPPVCMSYAFDNEKEELLHANFDRKKMEKLLWDTIRDPQVEWVAYNGASMEWTTTLAWRPGWSPFLFNLARKNRLYDPYLAEKLIRIAKGDSREVLNLAATLDDYCIPHTVDKSSRWRLRYGELWDVPLKDWPQDAVDYSLGDVQVRKLEQVQRQKAKPEYLVDQSAQARASISLSLTSAWGFPTDFEQATKLYAETVATLEKYKDQLLAAKLLRIEVEKGRMKFVRTKAVAVDLITKAYAKMGREAPRGDMSATMLLKAYDACGICPPMIDKDEKLTDRDIFQAVKDGVDEDLLQGNISTDEEACVNSRDPLLLAYTRYGQANTLLSKVRRLQRTPIQTSYNPIVNTGRTSSRQGEDPEPGQAWSAYGMQTQNLPRAGEEYVDEDGKKQTMWGARECFVAPGYPEFMAANPEWLKLMKLCSGVKIYPDECIISVDFDAFEMRTWAQCCLWILGYSDLAQILNDTRRCPHIEMGTRLEEHFNPDGKTWEEQFAWGYGLKQTDPKRLKAVRGLAKGPNFGLPGGMAWERLMDYCRLNYGVELDEARAKFACAVWREGYSEAQPYLDEVKKLAGLTKFGAKGSIVQFVSQRIRGQVGFCDASNGFFQGLAADAAKAAGWALMEEAYERTRSPFYGARPLAFVHDEWLFAVKRARCHEAGYRMRDVQVAAAQIYCPDVVLTAAPAAMYRWSKVAGDPFHVRNGKLCSFEDGGELIPYEETVLYK